jgi:tRNA threonylcarbamoyladenosine biosynthesis protein TsaE
MNMDTFISNSPEETQALGEACGREAIPGLVVALTGDLGTGKTQWTKGFARGLGITDRVLSPTFALVNVYEGGRLRFFHLDLYRMESREQILAAGLEEYFNPDGVTVVEWAEHWFGAVPAGGPILSVTIEATSETVRKLTYERPGH